MVVAEFEGGFWPREVGDLDGAHAGGRDPIR
jgi:hypothetical protein